MKNTLILELEGVSKRFGSLDAVCSISLTLEPGERHAVIGPNGAGKSTLFNLVAGAAPVSSGTVVFDGVDVTRWREARRARRGLARTFQHSNLCEGLSAIDNVALAAQRHSGIAWRPWVPARAYRRIVEDAAWLLHGVGLGGREHIAVSGLSHGERRQLEVAVALAADPVLLLLDEPTAGMSATETDRFVELVRNLPSTLTVLLIEHDIEVVFALATRVMVMTAGRCLIDGTPDEVRRSEAVQEAYFGGRDLQELFQS